MYCCVNSHESHLNKGQLKVIALPHLTGGKRHGQTMAKSLIHLLLGLYSASGQRSGEIGGQKYSLGNPLSGILKAIMHILRSDFLGNRKSLE